MQCTKERTERLIIAEDAYLETASTDVEFWAAFIKFLAWTATAEDIAAGLAFDDGGEG